jgi:hypothetical protein
MLKSKKAVYILLPIVILIWGFIIYRIFSVVNLSVEGVREAVLQPRVSQGPAHIDSFSINADYRDPFLGKMITREESEKPKAPVVKKEVPKPEPIVWPVIVYKGMIKNQKSNKQLCLVSIGGQDNIVKEGDLIGEIELKRLTKDSVALAFKKETKYFKK